MMTLAQLQRHLSGATLVGDAATVVRRVHSDTRTLQPGDLFVALRGERFDANDLLAQARAAGAVAALAHRGRLAGVIDGVEVDDTRAALGELAKAWRAAWPHPLIAVTGSNGKTTVTQMVAAILHAWQGDTSLATQGNFNNDIGVPLTLLRLREHHRIAVLELGMNHPGEIAVLSRIAQPTVALVNNAQREHQEFMVSVQAVALENGAVIEALPADGTAVFPLDDDYSALWRKLAGARRVTGFGDAADADVRCLSAEWRDAVWQVRLQTPAGAIDTTLAIAGRHNVRNAMAATACALAAGAPLSAIADGLRAFRAVAGRSRAIGVRVGTRDITLVDDSYNANPDSARAAIDVLAALPGPHLLVMGDMGEVGAQGPQFHAEVGAHARACGIERLYTLGEQSRGMGGTHHESIDTLRAAVLQALPGVGSVLVKGSRFMRMERVVEAITQHCGAPAQEDAHAH